ncbi:hypothetical protein EMCRGX_G032047 [Ephydatia muelleri]
MSGSNNWCFNYSGCDVYKWNACPREVVHPTVRYTDSSAVWVLIAAIIVFFMKAGFMLVEVSFAKTVNERRHVVIIKHMDAFASAFGFFLIGFDGIARYSSAESANAHFFKVSDPLLWFFKFTFASNAATVVGGCLVTNTYKMRLPAAFISAFVISGIIHPIVALIIWSDVSHSLSPYRFCVDLLPGYNCTLPAPSFLESMYVLDFAGSGAVHMLGGTFGLVLCLFAKLKYWRQQNQSTHEVTPTGAEGAEVVQSEGFWDWMYPVSGGDEAVSEAALGVIILWFAWFAFNCGSTESVEIPTPGAQKDPYFDISAIIAINMIMAAASGGTVAIVIATWAQVRLQASSINANEVANGVLSALVAITAGCPFVDYWGACLIGVIAVQVYHLGCWLEYRLDIKDTARVGLWGLIGTGLLVAGPESECNLHATFEGLCYCELRLPPAGQGERILAQILGSLIIFGIGLVSSVLLYGALYVIPINPFVQALVKMRSTQRSHQIHKPSPSWRNTYRNLASPVSEDLNIHFDDAFVDPSHPPSQCIHFDDASAWIQAILPVNASTLMMPLPGSKPPSQSMHPLWIQPPYQSIIHFGDASAWIQATLPVNASTLVMPLPGSKPPYQSMHPLCHPPSQCIHFGDASAWIQATLPVSTGGIGIHRAVQLAPSAFLASAAGTHGLIYEILPERMATIPYPELRKLRCPLIWDVTCLDTFATSYEMQAMSEARAVAALAERKKKIKYAAIAQTHLFYPIAIKTSGVFGPDAYDILCDLARQIKATSNKPNLTAYLFQQISVVVQRQWVILSLKQDGQSLKYEGGWLLTSPSEMKKSLVMSSEETIVTTSGSAFDDVALAQEHNDSYGSMSVTGHYMLQKRSK